MKPITFRVPDSLAAQIEAEARRRGVSKSQVVREWLTVSSSQHPSDALEALVDLIGAMDFADARVISHRAAHGAEADPRA